MFNITDQANQNPENNEIPRQFPERYTNWMHNVIDEYKGKSVEDIKQDLAQKALPFAILIENWQGDFNVGQCVRNANAFGAKEVYYLGGKRKYDRRAAVGTYKYTDVFHIPSIEELKKLKEKYSFVGVDNVPGSVPIENHEHKDNTLFIFGEEGCGLTSETIALCDQLISISQRGSVRSLNAGCASGIVMYDFSLKYVKKNK